jgi:hypothetical protein
MTSLYTYFNRAIKMFYKEPLFMLMLVMVVIQDFFNSGKEFPIDGLINATLGYVVFSFCSALYCFISYYPPTNVELGKVYLYKGKRIKIIAVKVYGAEYVNYIKNTCDKCGNSVASFSNVQYFIMKSEYKQHLKYIRYR